MRAPYVLRPIHLASAPHAPASGSFLTLHATHPLHPLHTLHTLHTLQTRPTSGSFLQMNTLGHQFNDVLVASDLERALRSGHTAIFHAHQGWVPAIRQFHQSLSRATKRHANTNTCLTGAGVAQSIAAHNDMQDTFIVQTHGAKRWVLWVAPEAMLPVNDDLVYPRIPVMAYAHAGQRS